MTRSTRYQGAIIQDHHILLIKQIVHNPITYSLLQRIQAALGYAVAPVLQDRTEELL